MTGTTGILRNASRACALIALLAAAMTSAQAQVQVRFGSVGGLTDAGVYLAEEFGFFKEAGITIAAKRMASAPTLVTSLATDQLDVAGISITPGLFTAVAQDIALRVVGDKQSFRKGFAATRLVVRAGLAKATKAETVSELRGKVVAVSARGSSSYFNLVQLIATGGLKLEDIKVVELAYPSMVAALTNGAIDGAYIIEPYLSDSLRQKLAVEGGDMGSVVGEGKSVVSVPLVYGEAFARKKDIAQAFMTAYTKGVRIYNDAFVKGKDKDKIIAILAKRAGVDEVMVRDSFPAGLDPNQVVDEQSLAPYQTFFISQKMIQSPADLSKLVDTSFARAAVEALGPYT